LLAVPGLPLEIEASRIPMSSTQREAHLYVVPCPAPQTLVGFLPVANREGRPLLHHEVHGSIQNAVQRSVRGMCISRVLWVSACVEDVSFDKVKERTAGEKWFNSNYVLASLTRFWHWGFRSHRRVTNAAF